MVVRNDMDRFHLVMDVIDRVPKLHYKGAHIKQKLRDKLVEHVHYISKYGDDMPEIRDWKWPYSGAASPEQPGETKSTDAADEGGTVRSGAPVEK
jgi:xylulose-5-phosphate/fructose-6-phosphate phosphoketolase